ncbi:MAG TPA: glycoside hydrolase family 97 catalytic domain-containing protein [Sandaracinaceae bacterium LLY-WYZ-13_1]|nr:glycoside hydrolase family 97 catalytic domain-containing protein [Sandaracinaceae bacterium LLY-WYZ-13_1]
MRKWIVAWCALATSVACGEGEPERWAVASPDGALVVHLALEDRGGEADYPDGDALYWSVQRDGRPVVEPSPLGVRLADGDRVTGLHPLGASTRSIEARYELPLGKRRVRANDANELELRFEGLTLIVRAYLDGVAFRYRVEGEGEATWTGEATGYRWPAGTLGHLAPYDERFLYLGSYENDYREVELDEAAPGTGWQYPALFELPDERTWAMVTEADLDADHCGTRLAPRAVDRVLRVRLPHAREGKGIGEVEPRAALPWTSPWRVLIVGELATVVESTLVDDVSRPSTLEDASFVRPGRVAWSWYSQGTGDAALQREYVDFAAGMGWEHVLIDAGWDRWEDVETVMPALVADAEARGVGVLLWYNSGGEHGSSDATPMDRMLDPTVRRAEMDRIAGWGVAGIKVDFFESDKQDRIQQYLGILEDAGERGLMVNFHGSTVPRGWQRTYPHLMTYEAVRGVEFYMGFSVPDAADDVSYVFTRNVVGSMDYTPTAFADALDAAGLTYAHSLALPVVFESAWTHFADRADADEASGYRAVMAAHPFVRELLRDVPTTWDDTRLLAGHPGIHAVLARRHGEAWWLAGIGVEARTVSVPLSFLGEGEWDLQLVGSGGAPDALAETTDVVGPTDALEVELSARDGFVARLRPR